MKAAQGLARLPLGETESVRIGPCLGERYTSLCVFLVGIMLAVSFVIRVAASVKANAVVMMKTRMEGNMMTAVQVICVVAGTALLGRSGDMFPILQGNARGGVALTVSDMGVSAGGFDSPLAPPPHQRRWS